MATKEDGAAGWDLYRESGFSLSLKEINAALVRDGYSRVSQRMFRHYQKLRRYGYESYLPINQLDVKTLEDPLWDQATRGRYLPVSVQLDVLIRFISEEDIVELRGTASDLSEGEATVKIKLLEKDLPDSLTKRAALLEVSFRETGEVRVAEVSRIWMESRERLVAIRVQFIDPARLEDVTKKPASSSVQAVLVVGGPEEDVPLSDVMQWMYWSFQTLEVARVLTHEILIGPDRDTPLVVPAPRITSISLRSPLTIEMLLAAPVLVAVVYVIDKALAWRIKWHEGTAKKYEGRVNKETAQRLAWERHQREALKDFDPQELQSLLWEALEAELPARRRRPSPPREDERIETIARKQLGPAAAQLVDKSKGQVNIKRKRKSVRAGKGSN